MKGTNSRVASLFIFSSQCKSHSIVITKDSVQVGGIEMMGGYGKMIDYFSLCSMFATPNVSKHQIKEEEKNKVSISTV